MFQITYQIFSSSLLNSLIASGLKVGQHKTIEFLARIVLDFFLENTLSSPKWLGGYTHRFSGEFVAISFHKLFGFNSCLNPE